LTENGNQYRFLKENPCFLSSPAIRIEFGARLLNFPAVFDDCSNRKAPNLGKN
jgi:hypothetical protein